MLKSHMVRFVRGLKRQRLFSLINLAGLTVSMISTLLIYLYVDHELSYDSFHTKAARIYRVNQTFIWAEDDKNQFSRTGPGVAVAMKEELPEVELVTSLHTPRSHIISYSNPKGEVISFEEDAILAADTNFFRVFDFNLLQGDRNSGFRLANTLMMTESTARKYFGDENPIGKLVRLSGTESDPTTYEVTGVLEDVPDNSTIKFDVLLSMKNFPIDELHWSWIWTQLETFILLADHADINATRAKVAAIPQKRAEETLRRVMNLSYAEYTASGKKWELFLQPLTTLHLPRYPVVGSFEDVGNITVVYALVGAAIFIILLSCINFMNLSTAQFTKRVKETSIRKVLGLGKRDLILDHLMIALLFCTLAALLALALMQLAMPWFNHLTQKTLALTGENLPAILGGLAALAILMAILSSSYPAFFLSRFRPAEALKGKFSTGGKGKLFRNGLVVFQFAVSMILIACTAIVFQQLRFFYQKDVGFQKENLMTVRHLESVGNHDRVIASMLTIPGVSGATACTSVPPSVFGGESFTAEGVEENFALNFTTGDEHFIPVLGIRLVLGRNFSKDQPYDKYRVIVNEATIRKLGWPMDASVIGREIRYPGEEEGFAIIGVVSDFNFWTLDVGVQPMAIFHIDCEHVFAGPRKLITLRIDPSEQADWAETIAQIRQRWKQHAGDVPFDYGFIDQDFDESYKTQERFAGVLTVMAILGITIACFGLLGMIIYALEQRTKEIGIRKVSGASVVSILSLISNSFMKLIALAFLIATPVAYFAMDRWLTEFAYRIQPSVWTFAMTGCCTMVVALLITSYHSLKAAKTNPVDVLKDE